MNVGNNWVVFLRYFLRGRVTLNDAFRNRLPPIGFAQNVMLCPRLDTVKKEVSVRCFVSG